MPALKIIAIVAAHNEADIIEQTTVDLICQGVEVYLIDHGSTDGTAERIHPLVGHGVCGIESLASDLNRTAGFSLTDILKRKEELAARLDADWFINHDADELREPPWAGSTLSQALELVDRLGWNAVDFAVLDFVPTHDRYLAGDDLRSSFEWFRHGRFWDRLQIRCWKKQTAVDLVSSGGHEARFPNRAVFPIRFLLRHYPIRTQAQGERKVFEQRLPRFDPDERARGWHVQYEGVTPGQVFLEPPETLTHFDAGHVRLQLQIHHRGVEALSAACLDQQDALIGARSAHQALVERLEEAERSLDQAKASHALARQDWADEALRRDNADREAQRAEALRRDNAEREAHAHALILNDAHSRVANLERESSTREADLHHAQDRVAALEAAHAELAGRLRDVFESRSWRWTAPLRIVAKWLLVR